jgi:hypothetical protein
MRVTPIIPSKLPFDPKGYLKQIEDGLDKAAQDTRKEIGKTVSTWKDKPDFVIEKDKMERLVVSRNKIYYFVSGGTRVRYATMTPNFKAKTSPSRYQARAGAGGVAYISKLKPRPGIKPRNFDTKTAKRMQPRLGDIIKITPA